ncbi:unnamed protein product [Sphenostylis stenocarpa]|uniref:Uncharacterized protein n=1 Tax=Sphenostylis stenocarpa TaxID=92480 RepID=A0AA86S326_9FABA|nr:unnamed protein product [Sphenostylis stenocarpa]
MRKAPLVFIVQPNSVTGSARQMNEPVMQLEANKKDDDDDGGEGGGNHGGEHNIQAAAESVHAESADISFLEDSLTLTDLKENGIASESFQEASHYLDIAQTAPSTSNSLMNLSTIAPCDAGDSMNSPLSQFEMERASPSAKSRKRLSSATGGASGSGEGDDDENRHHLKKLFRPRAERMLSRVYERFLLIEVSAESGGIERNVLFRTFLSVELGRKDCLRGDHVTRARRGLEPYCERDASRAGLLEMRPFGEAKSISGHQTLQLMRRPMEWSKGKRVRCHTPCLQKVPRGRAIRRKRRPGSGFPTGRGTGDGHLEAHHDLQARPARPGKATRLGVRGSIAAGRTKKRLLESLAIAIESGADARNRKKLDRDGTRAFGFLPSLQSRIAARRALAHQLRMECGIKDELSKAIFCLDSPSKDIPRKEENRKASKIPSSEGKRRTRTADYRSCPLANSNSDPKADGSGLDLRPGTASSLSPDGHRGFKTDWRVPKKRETASEAFANFPSQARAAELKHQRLLFRHWLLLSGIHSSPLSGKNSLEALGAMESGEVALVSWSAVSARVKMLDGARFALEMEMPNQVAKNHRFRRGNEFRKDPIPSDIESVGGISAAISAIEGLDPRPKRKGIFLGRAQALFHVADFTVSSIGIVFRYVRRQVRRSINALICFERTGVIQTW